MTAHSSVTRTHPRKSTKIFRGLLVLIFMLSLVGILPPEPAQAAQAAPQATTIIAALSDYGSGTTLEGTVATMIAGWNPARIVTAGDNYHYQNCDTYAECVGNYYSSYVTAQTFMPTMGNHDYDNPPVGLTAWNNYFTWLPTTPDSQRRWYDFVVGDVHFFMLDGNGNQSAQSAWLATAVPASTSTWNIAVLHQAPYSTGYYGDIAASQLTYGTYGIDFVISGHNHHYQRLVKADGGKTVRYFIDGYGGTDAANHSECGTHTSSAASEACLADVPGAIKITASDTSIMFQYYSSTGALQDTYTQAAPADNCGVISLKATADTWMRESADTDNYGSDQSLSVDAYSYSQSALVKWDLSGLPAGATISAASLTLNVIDSYDTSGTNLGLYYVKRNWVEGTNNGASGTGASYTYYGAGTGSWSSGGANDTTNDRSSTSMWGATTIALGSQTIALNATGLTTVQNWYSGSLSNYGVTIQNQSGSTQDYLVFDSREGARPPLLNLTYCVGSPAIGDLVWDDTDGDGIQDAGETGHAGVTVELRKKSDDSLVATTTTNAAGLFSFSNPASATYYLQFAAPAGYSFTLADQGSEDTLDSDAGAGGKTGDIVWTQGGTASVKWDAGLARSCTTVTSRVNASSDDAQQSGTTMSLTGSTLPISSSSLLWGARFQNVNVPNGATIQSAAITFRSSSAQSGSNGVRTLYGQAADNPTTFTTTASNLSGRTRTTASVIWNIASIYANTNFQSYLITNIVQEIVNRTGWAANNAMVILGPTTGTNTRTAYSYDGSSTYAPLLTITYCTAPGPTITTSGTLAAFNSAVGTTSVEQSYTVSGANLTDNLVITAPADFQISTTSGSGFGSTVSLVPSGGSVPSTTIYVRLNPSSATTYSAVITHTSTGATQKDVAVTGSSVPAITATSAMTAFSAAVGTYSAEQSYTVSGINLTDNIAIAAPADFEISTSGSGSGFGFSLSLAPANGVVGTTTIYVRFKRATVGTSSGNIAHTSSGATAQNVAVSGTASVYYTLTVNAGSGGSVTLNPTGGSYASGTVVTLNAVATTGYIFYGWSGDLSGSTNPATITMNGNKFVTATFVAGTCTTVNLTATEDTYLSANDVTFNNGGNTSIHVNGTTGDDRRTALLKWDVSPGSSGIPSTATVSAATMSLYVTDASTAAYNLYNLRRTWVEGISSQASSSTSANWNTYNGANSWGTVGAANTSSDRDDTNLWGAGTTTFNSTGSKTAALNTAGVAVVQGWIAGTTSNYGLIIQNYSGSTNTLYFSSSEATTTANRPKLNVTYCALSYTPAKPKPPAVTAIALSGSNDVDLGWDAVTQDVSNNPTTIAKYQVYGSHDPFFTADGSTLLLEQPTPPWALTFTHTGGSTGTVNWYYLVRAHNIIGESVDSVRRVGRFGFALVPGS